jgi:tellurite resistance protein TerB
MSFFDELKAGATDLTNKLKDEVKRFTSKDFHESVVAACAMIAIADGEITSDEKQKMMRFMDLNDAMRVFDKNKTIKLFQKYVEQMEFDVDIGRSEALSAIGKMSGKQNEARAVVRLACAIGAADGDFDADEKNAVREMCKVLSLDSSEFDL